MPGDPVSAPWLEGIRVLELTTRLPGAYCGRLLAMLGADVIKAESPDRLDESRRAGPFRTGHDGMDASGAYRYLHAQKRSMSLAVDSPSGLEVLRRLAGRVDVVLDDGALGWPPDVTERYDELRLENERLVVCALFPNGLEGPRAHYAGTELTELASAGWLFAPAPGGDDPVFPGVAAAHYAMGSLAASGIMLALLSRRRSGRGQVVEIPANEAATLFPPFLTMIAAFSGLDMPRSGDRFPFAVFECADGHVGISILTQRHWDGLIQLMGHPQAFDHPRFQSGLARSNPEVAREITEIIAIWTKTQFAEPTFHRAQALRVAVAIIPSPSQVLASAQYAARDYWVESDDVELGKVRIPGRPFIPRSRAFAPFRQAPRHGEHTAEVLTEAGVQ